jgi:hypothetical protein
MALPPKVTTGARKLLVTRVQRLARLLRSRVIPDPMLAMSAWLVGEAGWLLDPAHLAGHEQRRRETQARKTFGVCMWEPACNEDAPRGGGFCPRHAAQAEKLLRGLFAERKRKRRR